MKLMTIFRAVYLASVLTLLAFGVAEAHDCSSPGDCEQTAGYNGALGVAGAAIAIITAVTASQMGGAAATALGNVFGPGASGQGAAPPDLFPPTPPTEIISGQEANTALINGGMPTITINGQTYIVPPESAEQWPPGIHGGAWTTTHITDPATGQVIDVIPPEGPTIIVDVPPTPPTPPGVPGSTPGVPGSTPGVPGSTPGVPGSTPEVPGSTPEVPGSVPPSPPASVPGSPPASVPESPPASVPESPPTSVPGSPPASVPESPPASVPESPPASVPESPPASVPGSPPASVPESPPASVPESPPASVPESPPASVPESPPASVPASPPASVPPATGSDVDLQNIKDTLKDTSTGKDATKYIEDNKIPVKWGEPGKGSYWNGTEIVIDPNQSAGDAALTVVHEVNHAQASNVGRPADISSSTRSAYVEGMLNEETDGTIESIEAKNESVKAGHPIKGEFPLEPEYNAAYTKGANDYAAAHRGASPQDIDKAGKAAGRDAVMDGFKTGKVVTSTDKTNYPDYYGNSWSGQHPIKTFFGVDL